jgi:hypothetical protein
LAINTNPDVLCATWHGTRWQDEGDQPAVAMVRDPQFAAVWWPYCQPCIDEFASRPATHDVVYLDPARVRGADPDHYERTAAAVKRTFTRPWPDYPDRP